MLSKKICMIGCYGVGKTSLVARFISQSFSDKYHATMGVKIDVKDDINLSDDSEPTKLVVWDIAGEDRWATTSNFYLRGAEGFLLVVDGTRQTTWHHALNLHSMITEQLLGDIPFVCLLNKSDLANEWAFDEATLAPQLEQGWTIMNTSAKTGANVENAFSILTEKILQAE